MRLAGRRHDRDRAGERDSREDDVEAEDRRPGQPLEQNARDEQAEHAAAGRDADPGPDGLAALLGREDRRDHRQRHRHDRTPRRRPSRRAAPISCAGAFSEDRARARRGRRAQGRRRGSACARSGRRSRRPGAAAPRRRARTRRRSTAAASAWRPCPRRSPGSATFRLATARDDHHQREAHDPQHRPTLLAFVSGRASCRASSASFGKVIVC